MKTWKEIKTALNGCYMGQWIAQKLDLNESQELDKIELLNLIESDALYYWNEDLENTSNEAKYNKLHNQLLKIINNLYK